MGDLNQRIEDRAYFWGNERAYAWANDRVANLQFRRTGYYEASVGSGTGDYAGNGGAVMYSVHSFSGYKIDIIRFCYLQSFDPVRGWVTFGG